MDGRHVLLLPFAVQGHINPALQFAKRLARKGIHVTFTTTVFAASRITGVPDGISFATFSDGCDDGYNAKELAKKEYMSRFLREATNTLRNVIISSKEDGFPVTCVVYTIAIPCAAEVAREHHITSAMLWIQPAAVLVIFYCYFHEYEDAVRNLDVNDPNWSIQFPGLPLLKSKDLPSFILPSSGTGNIHSHVLKSIKTQVETLDFDKKPLVLVNSLHALEPEAIGNYNMIPIGPLIPSDGSISGDLFEKPKELYKEWLDSKDPTSVIYVSFGSILSLPKKQKEEIAAGLLITGRPFLWVIRGQEEEKLNFLDELEHNGLIVQWCSQLEVLSHPSVGCFVSHCGWNSTLESIVCGVPVIAFPHWADQTTNAKLIEDVWRTGVRVSANENGIITRDEVVRCVAMVMDDGDKGSKLRDSVKRWKELAMDAMEEGGSSDMNLNNFVDLLGKKQN